jgi:hypothetical protein
VLWSSAARIVAIHLRVSWLSALSEYGFHRFVVGFDLGNEALCDVLSFGFRLSVLLLRHAVLVAFVLLLVPIETFLASDNMADRGGNLRCRSL